MWGAGRDVVGLDGKLDVHDLGVGAQHVPRHVNLHEYDFVVHYLHTTQQEFGLGEKDTKRCIKNSFKELPPTDGVASSSTPIFIRLASKNSRRL